MKKLLIGISMLMSISAFAGNKCQLIIENERQIPQKLIASILKNKNIEIVDMFYDNEDKKLLLRKGSWDDSGECQAYHDEFKKSRSTKFNVYVKVSFYDSYLRDGIINFYEANVDTYKKSKTLRQPYCADIPLGYFMKTRNKLYERAVSKINKMCR